MVVGLEVRKACGNARIVTGLLFIKQILDYVGVTA